MAGSALSCASGGLASTHMLHHVRSAGVAMRAFTPVFDGQWRLVPRYAVLRTVSQDEVPVILTANNKSVNSGN